MAINYHIYANNGFGGAVDFTTPIATTALLTHAPAALAAPSDTTFAVRAFDTVTGLEERNVDAIARIVIDAAGQDVTARPAPPTGLTALPLAGPSVRVAWQYHPGAQTTPGALGRPTGFRVYAATPTISYAAPVATVLYLGPTVHGTILTGLTAGATYEVAVRSYNATGEEANTVIARVTLPAAGPLAVDDLIGAAIV